MTQQELDIIIENHQHYLMRDIDNWVTMCADLRRANLRCANLRYANLRRANLSSANLSGANLSSANLSGVDLGYANLSGANLRYANLSGANLSGADFGYANLSGVLYNEITAFFALSCPEEGSFIGYKRCGEYIVKLLITENAKRSSSTSRKCRCSEAKVLSITSFNGDESGLQEIASNYNSEFIYKVGEIVRVNDFDDNRWNDCSTGIHFFITRDEAVRYC